MTLAGVVDRVRDVAAEAGRSPDDVEIVVVSKGRTTSAIQDLYDLGHRDFGENRAQELAAKCVDLPSDIRWHFVGPLQSNKVRIVRPSCHLLHSLDRTSLAEAWVKGPGNPPPALLQVNIGREPQKGGVDPDDAERRCGEFASLGIPLVGLMAIPPIGLDARPFFADLRRLRDELVASFPQVRHLSMGMSDDYEAAVAEGATVIRPGRAIFER